MVFAEDPTSHMAQGGWGQADGSFVVDGIPAGVYYIVATDASGFVGVLHGISVAEGEEVDGVTITLVPGAQLLIHSERSEWVYFEVSQSGYQVALGDVTPDHPSTAVVRPGPSGV